MKTSAVELYLCFYSKRDSFGTNFGVFLTAEKSCFFDEFGAILTKFLCSNFAENFSKDRVFFRFFVKVKSSVKVAQILVILTVSL